ncbi:MSC_0621 family F1-like ATPase epsilon subunit [Mycoplasmopsis verecunda]|uniref:Uncharacterized protein n=1 Tax=Mycoplasmopsis verecunda TaxID=171291 RepID=A0A1T4KMB8_9BACT|nr:hypothetical protein [Mycoplasmopsis verecunda]WPB54295.1 hypothetical protein SAM46_02285 [Mycoplasmopsis verecunda]SJZ43513.1 hypothetical protein SAMN02745154_00112 [Mycoplasmopsis verecunda]
MNKIKCILASQNSQSTLYISNLALNINLQDKWDNIKSNSVGSFNKVFIKIKLEDDNNIYYILDNAFITYLNDEIKISYRGACRKYRQVAKTNEFIIQTEKLLRQQEERLKYLNACEQLNVSNIDKIEIYKLRNEIFINKAIVLFNLNKEETSCEK